MGKIDAQSRCSILRAFPNRLSTSFKLPRAPPGTPERANKASQAGLGSGGAPGSHSGAFLEPFWCDPGAHGSPACVNYVVFAPLGPQSHVKYVASAPGSP